MSQLDLFVRRSETDPNFVRTSLPDDQPIYTVAEAVREKMTLPDNQNGVPLIYYFAVKERDGEVLRGEGSLRDAGVTAGQHLTLLSEPTGGGV